MDIPPVNPVKTDKVFAMAYFQLRRNYLYLTVLHTIKIVMLLVFIPIDYTVILAENNLITAAMGLGLAVSLVAAIYYVYATYTIFGGVPNYL